MKEFVFTDLTKQGRVLECRYHGKTDQYMEGWIIREEDNGLVVGISLWPEDVAGYKYDRKQKSLNLWYQPQPKFKDGIEVFRIALLALTPIRTPKDITQMNVYDIDQEVKRMPKGKDRFSKILL